MADAERAPNYHCVYNTRHGLSQSRPNVNLVYSAQGRYCAATMRLSKIKLAGFKSFVDPTTILLPSNLIGIVGPNGCGKSNVIDAVRWVMGETSAKNLRGESMADVIFNGSTSRKPVGQAAIELVFDNSDGSLGGEYAKYTEISIRRVVTRDGQSTYYQNGSRCRRKDITDIFLGTGLGPRSYSIIEQGMISRLIEARPEDLRVFLEEAAGISKYKERRKETESRIQHTRENMERLADLRDELGKQLAHLERQSKTAEKYTALKQEERLVKAQLTTLRWHSLDEQIKLKDVKITEQETHYEAEVAKLRFIEADIEKLREQHVEASEAFNQVQGHYYSVGAEIARIEQSIQHGKERRALHQDDLKQTEVTLVESLTHINADQARTRELHGALLRHEPELETAREKEASSTAALEDAELGMQVWQTEWEKFNERSAEPARQAEVERTRIEHLEQQLTQCHGRMDKLKGELANLSVDELERDSETLLLEKTEQAETLAKLETALNAKREQINLQRSRITELDTLINDQRGLLQGDTGRRASLDALQQAALGKQEAPINRWLQNHGIAAHPRLAEGLAVEPGWESAVETVLGNWLDAVCVEDLRSLQPDLATFTEGKLRLWINHAATELATDTVGSATAVSLASKVASAGDLRPLLQEVFCVDTLAQAEALLPQLGVKQSVITRDALWLGPNWARVERANDAKAGIIQREQALKQLQESIRVLSARIDGLLEQAETDKSQLQTLEQDREQQQNERQQLGRKLAGLEARINANRERSGQIRQRIDIINSELRELEQQREGNQEQIQFARGRLESAIESMQQILILRDKLQAEREQIQGALLEARHNSRHDRERANELNIRIKTISTEVTSLELNQTRMQQQLEKMTVRRDELVQAIAIAEAPLQELAEQRGITLSKRVEAEAKLTQSRRLVEEIDHNMRAQSTARHQVEQASQDIRNALDQMRLDWQESSVRRKTLEEKLAETDYQLETLYREMPEGASIEVWETQVETLGQRIQRLGPINLAAIEEYQQQSERKLYLDAQNADLHEALETLESAIRKIDKETRTRFKDTYEKVNSGFKTMFPRLFGGGHAYLELTGEDLLDTGVTVMARPPGKRNSSIHLLSGGEKALTAVALVFSIFQLNPAPFCMLDEVDAPLDDANVGRFCKMVEEMSEHVQFIVITHNKITMEMSRQLNGVTMHEPGVSRIVAVDVNEAVELAGV